jgi:ketosteroid isomerase-like protein
MPLYSFTLKGQTSGNLASIEAARAAFRRWIQAHEEHNFEARMALYDPQFVLLNASAPRVVGIEAFRKVSAASFQANQGGSLEYKEEFAFGGADMAVLVGSFLIGSPEGATKRSIAGRVALVFCRNTQGEWRIVLDIDNNPPDVTPEQFGRGP